MSIRRSTSSTLVAVALACALGADAARAQDAGHVAVIRLAQAGYPASDPLAKAAAARAFFATHADAYDFLVVFPAVPVDVSSSDPGDARGRQFTVRNEVSGIGVPLVDSGALYGSRRRLKGFVDVYALVTGVASPSEEESLFIVAHEIAHQWSAQVAFRDPLTGQRSTALLGRDGNHWSAWLDSDASVLYGSDWRDAGSGSFVAAASLRRYSALDLHLMGLADAGEVPPLTLLEPSGPPGIEADAPPPPDGTTLAAGARVISIGDVVAVEGPRLPSARDAQRLFRAAFAIAVGPGQEPTPDQIAHVDAVRRAWANRFFFLTGGRAVMETELVEPASAPLASNPSVKLGVDWLVATQAASGAWEEGGLSVRASASAAQALALFPSDGPAASALGRAAAWLGALGSRDVDSAARRATALASAGMPLDADAPFDAAVANLDGGLGLAPGYGSTVLDSALAGLARAASGRSQDDVDAVASYLLATQNVDGGWPDFGGGASRVETTAFAVRLLAHATRRTEVALGAGAAMAFLSGQRTPGGGYGDEGRVRDAAEVVLALDAWRALSGDEAREVAAHLLAAQRADGSWDGSVHDTGVVLVALRVLLSPNLAIDPGSVVTSAALATEGEQVVLRARVESVGHVPAAEVLVRAFGSDGRPFGPGVLLPSLPAGSFADVSLLLDTTGHAGSTHVFVVVDPEGAVEQLSREDDRVAAPLPVGPRGPGVDLAVFAGSLWSVPDRLTRSPSPITVTATVANLGLAPAQGAQLALLLGETVLATRTLDLAAGAVATVSLDAVVPPVLGAALLEVAVNRDRAIEETRADNDSARLLVPLVPTIDLAVSGLVAAPVPVDQGRDLAIQFTLRNSGTIDAPAAQVSASILDAAGAAIATLPGFSSPVPRGAAVHGELAWRANDVRAAALRVTVQAPGDPTPEDDAATVAVQVLPSHLPNLLVRAGTFRLSPDPPLEGSPATVSAGILNDGAAAAGAFQVALWAGDPAGGGTPLGETTVADLGPGADAQVSFPWTPDTSTAVPLLLVIDPAGAIAEFDESDNRAVLEARPRSLPDLAVADADVQASPAFPRQGDEVAITVSVVNLGAQAAHDVPLELWLGAPETGGALLGSTSFAAVDGAGRGEATFTWATAGAGGTRRLVAIVNGGRSVVESSYDNDRAEREILVQDGTVALSNPYFSPNGDGIRDDTRVFFRLAEPGPARVEVLDGLGRVVRRLETSTEAGSASGSVAWDGRDERGKLQLDATYHVSVVLPDLTFVGGADVALDTNRTSVVRSPPASLAAVDLEQELQRHQPADPYYWFDLQAVAPVPDGSGIIAYASRAGSTGLPIGVYRLGLGGSDPVRLTDHPFGWRVPVQAVITPDGASWVYLTDDYCPAVERLDVGTGDVTRITGGPLPESGGCDWSNYRSFVELGTLSMSPDGEVLAFAGQYGDIEAIRIDGSDRRVLLEDAGWVRETRFSPDGAWIAARLDDGGLTLVAADGSGSRRVLEPAQGGWGEMAISSSGEGDVPDRADAFAWLSDAELVFLRENRGIYVLDATSGDVRPLWDAPEVGPASEEPPTWALTTTELIPDPSGDALAFAYDRISGNFGHTSQLWTVPASGGDPAFLFGWAGSSFLPQGITDLEAPPSAAFIAARTEPAGFPARWMAVTTLANLGAKLVASRAPGGGALELRGSATDLHFDSWELTARPLAEGGRTSVLARSTRPVVNGTFTSWTPPQPGIHEVTLTARDLAGNARVVRTKVGWSETPAIAQLRRDPEFFSPNGDGRVDVTTLAYDVQSPITTELRITDEGGALVRTQPLTHLDAGEFSFVWDGRGDAGDPAPDGIYAASLERLSQRVVVDRVAPEADLNLGPDLESVDPFGLTYYPMAISDPCGTGIRTEGAPRVPLWAAKVAHRAFDEHLEAWALQSGQEPSFLDVVTGSDVDVRAQLLPLRLLDGSQLRLAARDLAGNESLTAPVTLEERLLLTAAGPADAIGDACLYGVLVPAGGGGMRLPRLDLLTGLVNANGARQDIPFEPMRWAFAYDESVGPRLVDFAVAHRSSPAESWIVDRAGVSSVQDVVVVWDARALPPGRREVQVWAWDENGRKFVAEAVLGEPAGDELLVTLDATCPERGPLERLPLQVNLRRESDAAGQPPAAVTLDRATLTFTERDTRDRRVVAMTIPALADSPVASYGADVDVSSYDGCRYDVSFEGWRGGESFRASTFVNLCSPRIARGDLDGRRATLVLSENFSRHGREVQRIDVYLTGADGLPRFAGAVPRFFGTSSPLDVELPPELSCQTLQVATVTWTVDGDVFDSRAQDAWCAGGGALEAPCTSISVGVPRRDASPGYCSPHDAVWTIPATASTAGGHTLTGVSAVVRPASGFPTTPLAILPIVPGPSADTLATFATEGFAEGAYRVTFRATDSLGTAAEATGPAVPIVVDRTPPAVSVTWPTEGAVVCAEQVRRSDGRLVPTLVPQGSVSDAHLEAFTTLFRCGGEEWRPFSPTPRNPLVPTAFTGALGAVDVGGRTSGDCELRIDARDLSGGSACSAAVRFRLAAGTSVAALRAAPVLFSPDGDGVSDATEVSFELTEDAHVTVTAVDASGRSGGVLALDAAAGPSTFPWDGTIAGAAVADGDVRLSIGAVDRCGQASAAQSVLLRVDTKAPVVRIDSPAPGADVGAAVTVSGEATDGNLAWYELQVGAGASPASFTIVARGDKPTTGVLGAVATSGLPPGDVTVRLVAADRVGHVSSRDVVVHLRPPVLVDALSVSPDRISPDGNGVLDVAVTSFTLSGAADVEVAVVDANGLAVAVVLPRSPLPAGEASVALGPAALAGVDDGLYAVRLTASAAGLSDVHEVPLGIDLTGPQVSLRAPDAGSWHAGPVELAATVADEAAQAWHAVRTGPDGVARVVAEGEGPFSGTLAVLGELAEGEHRVRLAAVDAAGNTGEASVEFGVDRTAPGVAFVSPRDGSDVSSAASPIPVVLDVEDRNLASASVSVERGGQSVQTVWEGTVVPAAVPWTAGEGDGPAELVLKAADRSGNVAEARVAVFVDRTPPVARLTAPSQGYLQAPATFSGTAQDDRIDRWRLELAQGAPETGGLFIEIGGGTSSVVDGALTTLASLPADGTYTARLTVVDRAGNASSAETSFAVDTSPPAPPPGVVAAVRPPGVEVTWSPSPTDDVAGYRVERARAGLPFSQVGPGLVTGPSWVDGAVPDGEWQYRVVAVDGAGLESAPAAAAPLRVDFTPPAVAIARPTAGASVGGTVDVVGTASSPNDFKEYRLSVLAAGGGVATIQRSGVPVAAGVLGTLEASALPAGPVTLRLEAEDLAGNVAETSVALVVDDAPPRSPVLLEALAVGSQVVLVWQPSPDPDVAGLLVLRDGVPANAPPGVSLDDLGTYLLPGGSTGWTDPSVGDGEHAYQLQAIDHAGNASALSNSIVVAVETGAPSAVIASPARLARIPGSAVVAAECPDVDLASLRIEARAAGGEFRTLGAPLTAPPFVAVLDPTALTSPVIDLRAVATDLHGNVDPAPPSTFVFFDPPPSPPMVAARVAGDAVALSWTPGDGSPAGYAVERDGAPIVAAGRPAGTASASRAEWPAARGYDAAAWTYWRALATGNEWWRVDLGSPVLASALVVNPYGAFDTEASVLVRGAWIPLDRRSATSTYTVQVEPPIEISAVRLDYRGGAGTYVGLNELTIVPVPLTNALAFSETQYEGTYQYTVAALTPFGQRAAADVSARVYRPHLAPPAASRVATTPVRMTGWTYSAAPGQSLEIRSGETVLARGTAESATRDGVDGNFAVDVPLAPGTNVLTAVVTDAAGNVSLPSLAQTLTLDPPPDVQIALSLDRIDASDVSLSFAVTGDTSRVSGFKLRRRTGSATREATLAASARTALDAAVPNGVHRYELVAYNASGFEGLPSNAVEVTVSAPLAAGPMGLAVTPLSSGSALRLDWAWTGAAVRGFVVERALDAAGPFAATTGTPVTGTSHVDEGLAEGTRYWYRVRAVDLAGNAGLASDVVSGVPSRTVPLARPVLVEPTLAGRTYATSAPAVLVRGVSEPGTTVDLFRNGARVGSATVGAVQTIEAYLRYSPQAKVFAITADARTYALDTGTTPPARVVLNDAQGDRAIGAADLARVLGLAFSPAGTMVIAEGLGTDGSAHLWTADVGGTALSRTGASPGGSESSPSWSPDGRSVAFEGRRPASAAATLTVVDVATGVERTVAAVAGADVRTPRWLPGGEVLAAVVVPRDGAPPSLTLFDAWTGTRTDVLTRAGLLTGFALSPDGSLAAVRFSGAPASAVDLSTHATHQLPAVADQVAFAADGRSLLYQSGWVLRSVDLESWVERTVSSSVQPGATLSPVQGGLVTFSAGSWARVLAWGGVFELPGVALATGDNHLVAVARDGAGRTSEPSRAASVTRAALEAADLALTGAVQPAIPVAGEPTTLFVRVRNAGAVASQPTRLRTRLLAPEGVTREGGAVPIPAVEAGQEIAAAVPLELAGLSGVVEVHARLDPAEAGGDPDPSNDEVRIVVVVASRPGIAIAASVSPQHAGAGSEIGVSVSAANAGPAADADVRVSLVDAAGAEALHVTPDSSYRPLGASETVSFQRTFSTTGLLAGSYRVVAEARAGGVPVAAAEVPFAVDADRTTLATVLPLRASFAEGELVEVQARVENGSSNAPLDGALLRTTFLDAGGTVAHEELASVPDLWMGAATSSVVLLPGGTLAPGAYVARVRVEREAEILAEASAPLSVVGRARLVASAAVSGAGDPPAVRAGASAPVSFAVLNQGSEVAAVRVHVSVVDPAGSAILSRWTFEAGTLAPDATYTGALALPTAGLPLGVYGIAVGVEHQGASQVLATARFRVADAQAPALEFLSLREGGFVRDRALAAVRARDDASGTASVTATVAGGAVALARQSGTPLDGVWSGTVVFPTEGTWEISAQASDTEGNSADTMGSGSNPIRVVVVSDVTPPAVAVRGVEEGALVRPPVTPVVEATDLHLASVDVRLDGLSWDRALPVTSDGEHLVSADAIDLAGNATRDAVRFTIDGTAPSVTIAGVDDGAVVARDVTPVVVVTDLHLDAAAVTLDGQPFSPVTLSADADHVLAVDARDLAGNETHEIVRFSIDRTAPTVAIAGVSEGEYAGAPVAPTFSAEDAHLLQVEATLDGRPFRSGERVSAEGAHLLRVTAVDAAGNVTRSERRFTVDTTAPKVWTSVEEGAQYDGPVAVSYGATDANLEAVAATLDGVALASGTVVEAAGAHVLTVTATDRAGRATTTTVGFSVVSSARFTLVKRLLASRASALVLVGCDDPATPRTEAFLRAALPSARLTFVSTDVDFLVELRSGTHDVFVLTDALGVRSTCVPEYPSPPLSRSTVGQRVEQELTEAAYRGAGILTLRTTQNAWPKLAEVLGLTFEGDVASDHAAIQATAVSGAMRLAVGDGVDLRLREATEAGRFDGSRGVALALRPFGAGATVTLGFDPAAAAPQADASALVSGAMAYLSGDRRPGPHGVVAVQIQLSNEGAAADVVVRETLDPALRAVWAFDGGSVTGGGALEWSLHAPPAETIAVEYRVRLPATAGAYATATEVLVAESDGLRSAGSHSFTLALSEDGPALLDSAEAAVAAVPSYGTDASRRTTLLAKLAAVRANAGLTAADRERAISDLLDAAAVSRALECDPFPVRLALADLLAYWEAKP